MVQRWTQNGIEINENEKKMYMGTFGNGVKRWRNVGTTPMPFHTIRQWDFERV